MSSTFHSVTHTIGDAAGSLFGGSTHDNLTHAGMSASDQAAQADIIQKLNALYNSQDTTGNQNLFRQHLTDFLNSGNPNPTPQQMAQATSFVDQTFTRPNQLALNQYNQAFGANQNAQAAALGRNPNSDIATQQAIYGEGLRGTLGLQAQRQGLIAQQAQNLNNMTFGRQATQSQFLNGLQQQAFANQMGLLNARSGMLEFNQNDRMKNPYNPTTTSPGLLGQLGSYANGLNSFGSSMQGLGQKGGIFGTGGLFGAAPASGFTLGTGAAIDGTSAAAAGGGGAMGVESLAPLLAMG